MLAAALESGGCAPDDAAVQDGSLSQGASLPVPHEPKPPACTRRQRRSDSIQARLANFDQEIAELEAQANLRSERCKSLTKDIVEARAQENQKKEAMRRKRARAQERVANNVARMQASIRGWLARRSLMRAVDCEKALRAGVNAKLPDKLREDLADLQYTVRKLLYRDCDREEAAVRIQSFWRRVLAQRVQRVLWTYKCIHRVMNLVKGCAVGVTSYVRMSLVYKAFRRIIVEKLQAKSLQEAQLICRAATRLQSNFRKSIAQRKFAERRALNRAEAQQRLKEESKADESEEIIDLWRPKGWSGTEPPCAPGAPCLRKVDRLEQLGLTPFYKSYAQDLVRHRIGGPQALRLHAYLKLGEDDWQDVASNLPVGSGEGAGLLKLCETWDLYPDGLSVDFLENLDEDVWPWPCKARDRRKRRIMHVKVERKRRIESAMAAKELPPPTNSAGRAAQREDDLRSRRQRQEEEAAAQQVASERMILDHPMFENAPPVARPTPHVHPTPPSAPRKNPPRPQRAPAAAALKTSQLCGSLKLSSEGLDYDDREDSSWTNAMSFFHGTDKRR